MFNFALPRFEQGVYYVVEYNPNFNLRNLKLIEF